MQDKHFNKNFRLKTQKALQIINQHEVIQTPYLINQSTIKQQVTMKASFKILRERDWNKIILLEGTSELYELMSCNIKNQSDFQQPIASLKLIIKDIRGAGIRMTFSSRPEIVAINDCEHKIDRDKIIKMKNLSINATKIYLTIHSPIDLTIFKLKYEFQVENKSHRVQSLQSTSSVKFLKINSITEMKSSKQIIDKQKEEVLLNLKKGNFSPHSIIRDKIDLETTRMKSIERQKQKVTKAKSRKADLQKYRQKNKSLKVLSNQAATVFKEYQQGVNLMMQKKEKAGKYITLLLCAALFLRNTNLRLSREKLNLEKANKRRKFLQKCVATFMKMLQSVKIIQPRRMPRALLPVHHHLSLTAKILLKNDSQTAEEIIGSFIQANLFAFNLNKAFDKCAIYRRKIRAVQRFWLNRNKAQITMLEFYVQKQVSDILTKFPKFIAVKQQFYTKKMAFYISWQYLKQISEKIKILFAIYRKRLVDIEEIKKANKQIDQFNKKALKKHLKEFIEVPATPRAPQCRYFRDLGTLKSMVRGWFEIQFRKYAKKHIKQNDLSPRGQQK